MALPVAEYRAPSWSWGSFDGDIKYDTLRDGFFGENKLCRVSHGRDVEILGHYIHPTTSDPFGIIDEVSLTVRGYFAEAFTVALTPGSKSVETVDFLPVPMPGKDGAVPSSWQFDIRTAQNISSRYVLLQVSRWALTRKVAVGNVDNDDNTPLAAEDLEILYIAALVLAEADKVGEYRRVGFAEIKDEHRGKIWWGQRDLTLV